MDQNRLILCVCSIVAVCAIVIVGIVSHSSVPENNTQQQNNQQVSQEENFTDPESYSAYRQLSNDCGSHCDGYTIQELKDIKVIDQQILDEMKRHDKAMEDKK